MLDADPVQQTISPVLTLPCEITSEIFVQCLPTLFADLEWNTVNPSEAPMLLLHVCKIWRDIAIDMPALWTRMELSMDSVNSHEMAQAWLGRAKACPLSVKLHQWPRCDEDEEDIHDDTSSDEDDDEGSSSDEEEDETRSIFQTLLDRADNLKFLELSAIPLKYIRKLDQLSGSCSFPSLQKLTIGIDQTGLGDWESETMYDPPCAHLFTKSPNLRELSLVGDTPPLFLECLPWHQSMKYTGTCHNLYLSVDALRLGSNLVECALASRGIDTNWVEILVHPTLKSLTLFKDENRSTDIFQFLTLPALETLRILDCEYEWFSNDEFLEFLMRSSPPLRQFTIRFDDGVPLDVDVLSMPSLVELEIWNPHQSFLPDFFNDFLNDAFLPQLQRLSFFHPRHSSADIAFRELEKVEETLSIGWIASHHGHGQLELKSFQLVWDWDVGDLPQDILCWFMAMESDGLNISIKSPTRSYIDEERLLFS